MNLTYSMSVHVCVQLHICVKRINAVQTVDKKHVEKGHGLLLEDAIPTSASPCTYNHTSKRTYIFVIIFLQFESNVVFIL